MARHGVLPNAILPAFKDRAAHRHVLHGRPGVCRRRRACLGRLPADGRRRWPGRLPVDVPHLRTARRRPRRRFALVASRPPPRPWRKESSGPLDAMAAAEPRSPPGRRRRRPLPRSPSRLSPSRLDAPRSGPGPHRLEAVAAGAHVLWRRGRGDRHAAVRDRHHLRHQPQVHRCAAQPTVCAHLDCE